jgi:hypothetical protein
LNYSQLTEVLPYQLNVSRGPWPAHSVSRILASVTKSSAPLLLPAAGLACPERVRKTRLKVNAAAIVSESLHPPSAVPPSGRPPPGRFLFSRSLRSRCRSGSALRFRPFANPNNAFGLSPETQKAPGEPEAFFSIPTFTLVLDGRCRDSLAASDSFGIAAVRRASTQILSAVDATAGTSPACVAEAASAAPAAVAPGAKERRNWSKTPIAAGPREAIGRARRIPG